RNAINNGLPLVEAKGISGMVEEGDVIEIDLDRGIVKTPKGEAKSTPLPPFLQEILKSGGLVEYYKAQVKREQK
ncbi:MAG: 3-isopropylmalate dehydratase small subunit, partial [Candidatus Methanosuratincola petrocarbonis]